MRDRPMPRHNIKILKQNDISCYYELLNVLYKNHEACATFCKAVKIIFELGITSLGNSLKMY